MALPRNYIDLYCLVGSQFMTALQLKSDRVAGQDHCSSHNVIYLGCSRVFHCINTSIELPWLLACVRPAIHNFQFQLHRNGEMLVVPLYGLTPLLLRDVKGWPDRILSTKVDAYTMYSCTHGNWVIFDITYFVTFHYIRDTRDLFGNISSDNVESRPLTDLNIQFIIFTKCVRLKKN